MMFVLAAVELVTLHMIDGRQVQINPMQITQMLHTRGDNRQFADKVNCIIRLTDGSFLSVAETCEAVQKALKP